VCIIVHRRQSGKIDTWKTLLVSYLLPRREGIGGSSKL
jgi:hypothetical protein